MKRIDELVISPLPWKIGGRFSNSWIDCRDGHMICDDLDYRLDEAEGLANANILVASPDMYKTEYDLVNVIERLMNGWAGTCATPSQDEVVAAIEAAKNALAKAAGEEVKDA